MIVLSVLLAIVLLVAGGIIRSQYKNNEKMQRDVRFARQRLEDDERKIHGLEYALRDFRCTRDKSIVELRRVIENLSVELDAVQRQGYEAARIARDRLQLIGTLNDHLDVLRTENERLLAVAAPKRRAQRRGRKN
jgi:hypothetical protein